MYILCVYVCMYVCIYIYIHTGDRGSLGADARVVVLAAAVLVGADVSVSTI